MILKLDIDLWGLKVYKVSIYNDPGLTITYFKARSNLVKIAYCASPAKKELVQALVHEVQMAGSRTSLLELILEPVQELKF